ncbi:MAG: hypothetical protein Q8L79_05640 [Methylobacter sp.]|uniref:hypothetical protein n=1 Tax=Methylobacter sp. TaxID=2051955 RepID=UPI00273013DF|nr:hypothetical protein [Methylobacter sp.]MDP1664593.1 hypothetical protein [Methylobacter sp.]
MEAEAMTPRMGKWSSAGSGCRRLHGQEMIPSFLCIPHIPVGYAGGRATQGAVAERSALQLIDHIIHQVFQGLVHELV